MNRPFYAAGLCALLAACGGRAPTPDPPIRLVDVTRQVGLAEFQHRGGRRDKAYLADTTGSGVCALDYDGDGDDDLYLVNGTDPERAGLAPPPRDSLYRNDGGRFTEVTEEAGLGSTRWGQGCAVGDYDGDGLPDLYVTNLMEPDILYHNTGGAFEDVTSAAGLGDPGWGTGAVWLDLEGDGDLDLYVVRYVDFGWEPELAGFPCSWMGLGVACGPMGLRASADRLYCNRGGTFEECSERAGLAGLAPAYGMSVLAADMDGDGDTDLYVANDAMPNYYLENEGGGRLAERAEAVGLARNGEGRVEAGMGLAWLDGAIYVTNFSLETDTLYVPSPGGGYRDATGEAGLAGPTRTNLSWGVAAFDPDLDGDLDLFVASGHIYPQVDAAPDLGTSYLQPDLFFRNLGGGRFRYEPEVLAGVPKRGGRGVAVLDIEGDGDPDLVINNLDGPPTVLRAEGAEGRPHHVPPQPAGGGSYLSSHGRSPRGGG